MSRLEKLKVQKVWGDEIFYAAQTIEDITVTAPSGVTFTEDSTIIGEATVAVTNCELSEDAGAITAAVEFMVQEELTVQIGDAPGPDDFELEYAFRFNEQFTFQKTAIPAETNLEDLHCQVFRFEGTVGLVNVDLPNGLSEGSFDNAVNTMTKLKVIEEIQAFVALGDSPYVKTSAVTSTPV